MSAPNWQRIAATTWKPGQKCRRSGQFAVLDRNGEPTGEERTIVKGETFPPTPLPGQMYRLVDATQHKGDEDAPA